LQDHKSCQFGSLRCNKNYASFDSSLVTSFKIETNNDDDSRVKSDFDVTALVTQTLKSSDAEYDIRKNFGVGMESELNLSE